ncbi:hypothetical protein PLESTM_001355600 [Pleodorina starrii]|nr:hypothetical protein PLESTM_001355600 [Pleodorina starrii]
MLLFRLPTWGKLLVLVLVGLPIVVLGSALLMRVTDMAWGQAAQLTFYVLQNVPGVDITGFSPAGARLVLVAVHLLSLYTFATLVGLLTEDVRSTVEEIRCGNFPIPSRGHTVILDGSGDANRVIGTLTKVLETRGAHGGDVYAGDIAILTSHPKDELDRMIADVLPRQAARVVTRYGNPAKVADLERVAAVHARTVLLLAPDRPMGHVGPELQQQLCLTALRTLHQPHTHNSNDNSNGAATTADASTIQRQRVVVETRSSEGAPAAAVTTAAACADPDDPLHVTYVSSTSSAFRVAVQCAVQPGLAAVFDAVFCQEDDAALRLVGLPEGLEGRTFAEVRRRFRRAVVCGLLPAAAGGGGGSGRIQFSPPDDQRLSGGDRLVLLAAGPEDCLAASGEQQPPDLPPLSPPNGARRSLPSRLVLLALDSRLGGELAEALREFAVEGSTVTVVSPEECRGLAATATAGSRLDLDLVSVVGDPLSPEVLAAAGVSAADAVILTGTDDLPADEADAQAVGTALVLQQLLAATGPRVTPGELSTSTSSSSSISGAAAAAAGRRPLTFVCSLRDPQNRSVLQHIGVEACRTAIHTATAAAVAAGCGGAAPGRGLSIEVIEPEALISGMLAQVGAEPLLVSALEDLLDEEGCEIYIKRCDRYGIAPGSRVSWAQVAEVVRQEDDVALGFLHRGRLHLAPPAEEVWEVAPGDKLVVLSEAFL